jgi:hypothetical protein
MNELTENEDATVVCQDEVHFQITTSVTRKRAPKGSNPKVKSAPAKKNAACSGYVVPTTGELIVTKPGWFNYETVTQSPRDFICAHPAVDGHKIYMALDNAPWHKKRQGLFRAKRGLSMRTSGIKWSWFRFRRILRT